MIDLLTPSAALRSTLLTLCLILGLMWLAAMRLGLSRRAARHWGVSALMVGGGFALLTPSAANSVPIVLMSYLMVLGGTMLVARGMASFTRSPPRDFEHLCVLLLCGGGMVVALLEWVGRLPLLLVYCSALTWVLLRAAWLTGRALRAEMKALAAWLCVAPLVMQGLFNALRALAAALGASLGEPVTLMDDANAAKLALMLWIFAYMLLLNGGLLGMVLLRLISRLQHLSLHDPLTGLPNRRSLNAALTDELHRMARGGPPFALLSMDVDHFKRVNDAHGHDGGDAALKHMAEVLRSVTRASDRPARVGGEEFALLLPATDGRGARCTAERLLQALRDRPLNLAQAELRLTLSVGAALIEAPAPDTAQALRSLWKRADLALYAAKSQGRDRVVLDGPQQPAHRAAADHGPG